MQSNRSNRFNFPALKDEVIRKVRDADYFLPTEKERDMVKELSGYGVPFIHIATLIRGGITQSQLVYIFSDELKIGRAQAIAIMSQKMFEKAILGDSQAMTWWSKVHMGWRDQDKKEEVKQELNTIDVSQLSDDALNQIMAAKDKIK